MPYQVAVLLHTIGDEGLKAYNSFRFETPEDARTVEEIIAKFDTFAVGETNETYERFIFNKRKQEEGESFELFYSSIRTLMRTCNFCQNCVNSILRDKIVTGIRDPDTRSELLRARNLTLEDAVRICKTAESAKSQGSAMEAEKIHKVATQTKPSYKKECKFCGKQHEFKPGICPAYGRKCANCKLWNHFAAKCPKPQKKTETKEEKKEKAKKKVHQVQDDPDSESEWVNAVRRKTETNTRDIKCQMLLIEKGKMVTFQVDTGATLNLLPEHLAPRVERDAKTLRMWNNAELTSMGKVRTDIRNMKNNKKYSVQFTVVQEDLMPILGCQAATQMGLVQIQEENMHRVAVIKPSVESVLEEYKEVFSEDLGTLPGNHSLKVDESVQPVIMPTNRTPLAKKAELKTELDRLTKLGVLCPVEEPTPWVSQLVITQKQNGKMRICLDPRELNKALKREHFQMPVLDEVLHELGESRIFTKADLSNGYWHVQLTEESSHLTTMNTDFGRYRWRRLPFGLTVSAEIFQKKILYALQGMEGIVCLADDVIIHGKTEEEHMKNLRNFLKRCKEKNIRLNKEKMKIGVKEVTFMGHVITSQGLKTDPEKVRAVTELQPPKNIHQLRQHLGLINYIAKFLPRLSEVISPLLNLTRKDVPWCWSTTQQEAFDKVKSMVKQTPCLSFYDPSKELTVESDASEHGLGSVLMQSGSPIFFASRSLSETEKRYSQIEKEMLALTFGLRKFHHFTYGRHVNAITDHKPLVSIVRKPLSKAPRRLQNLLLKAMEYDFSLSYKPGKEIPVSDALSRTPLPETEQNQVNLVTYLPIKGTYLQQVQTETNKDGDMKMLKEMIIQGWPSQKDELVPCLLPYFSIRDELSVQDQVIIRGSRIVIPKMLRRDVMKKIHTGHLGVNSCLRQARELVYWPGMSTELRQYIEGCHICATYADRNPREPLKMTEIPEYPWQKVATDLFTIAGRDYLITVDYYSQFFEVDYLPNTTSMSVVTKLKHHFARHGIPEEVVSDGGPQYSSSRFKNFADEWAFKHTTTSPYNSKSNGAAEAAVKTAKKIMRKAAAAKEDPYLGILNFRNTPTEGIGSSPTERLFGRRTRTMIPAPIDQLGADAMQRNKMVDRKFSLAAQRETARELKPLSVGTPVTIDPTSRFSKERREGTVIGRSSARSYEVQTASGTLRRNRAHLRPMPLDREQTCASPVAHSTPIADDITTPVQNGNACTEAEPMQTPTPRRSSRIRKAPERLDL